ncbi:non-canonical purine NTP diphosphatase [Ulvibacterium sp.]|uniref:non-canonical purine NTP diphosphatase n=1 Tax=Ulvibacterium sp. TaxID=2665914 RepID=UPI003BA99959
MRIVFATHNPNKIKEVLHILPKHIDILSLTDIGCTEEIPETGQTLEENALLKAEYVVRNYGYPCFADDTGLIVDALGGAPGVYSARYAGANKNADKNMAKLLSKMEKKPNRSARFKTVIALLLNGEQKLFTGKVEGEILHEKKGEQGFGYDPIFKPTNFDQTFAELPLSVKNKIGHRGKAVRKLVDYLKQTNNSVE